MRWMGGSGGGRLPACGLPLRFLWGLKVLSLIVGGTAPPLGLQNGGTSSSAWVSGGEEVNVCVRDGRRGWREEVEVDVDGKSMLHQR